MLAAGHVLGVQPGWDGEPELQAWCERILSDDEAVGEPGDAGLLHSLAEFTLGEHGIELTAAGRAEAHARLLDGVCRTREADISAWAILALKLARRLDVPLIPLVLGDRVLLAHVNSKGEAVIGLDPFRSSVMLTGDGLKAALVGHQTLLTEGDAQTLASVMRRRLLLAWLHGLRDLFMHGPALEHLALLLEMEGALDALPGSLVDEVQRYAGGRAVGGALEPEVATRCMDRLDALQRAEVEDQES